jgi:hypothetical protein
VKELIEAIDKSVASGNWYGALFIAISLPDICGKIDNPTENSSRHRYATWFNKYIQPRYTSSVGPNGQELVFLSGNDCYALRCAYLHEGSDDTSRQRAREAADRFLFVVAPQGCIIHCNMIDTILQLQIDIFCEDIKQGVIAWVQDIQSDSAKLAATKSLLRIQFPDANGGIRI